MKNKDKDLLIDALKEIKATELSEIPNKEEIDHTFSPEFDDKTAEIKKTIKKNSIDKIGKIAAVISIVLIASIIVTYTARSRKSNTFIFDYDISSSSISITFGGDSNKSIELTEYLTPNIPDGFIQQQSIYPMGQYLAMWADSSGNRIILTQSNLGIASDYGYPASGCTASVIKVNNLPVLFCSSSEDKLCYAFWNDTICFYAITYPYELGSDFLNGAVGHLTPID